MNNHYTQVEKYLHQQAWSWAKKTEIDRDECLSKIHELYMTAETTWEQGKGTFLTYLRNVVRNGMINFAKKEMQYAETETGFNPTVSSHYADPLRATGFREALREMSDEAKEVVNLVMDVPDELSEMTGIKSAWQKRGFLRSYLKRRGWTWKRYYKAQNEIKELLRTF